VDFEVRRGGRDDVDRLETLWRQLWHHHASLPAMPGVRTEDESWRLRRGEYLRWLEGDEHTLLLAERTGTPIGYAMVSIGEGATTWALGEITAEIETLSVLEGERGTGVGQALTEHAAEVAREAGAGTILVAAAHSNEDAVRFYERQGFSDFYVLQTRPL
jgi:ribosomal protein S18 acetylase RimI-like enzyme